jgi:hypothetical protein
MSTSRELLIASLLIVSALVYYELVVKISSANNSSMRRWKKYPGEQLLCAPVIILTLTRVNSTNIHYEGLRIGGIGRRMNSKVKSVKQGAYRK